MKRLSRNDIEAIAEKYVKAYLELPEIKSAQVYRIEPEIMLEKVLGLNVEYMHLSYDGSILGMTSFGELGVQVFENDDEEAFFFLDGKTVLVESDLNYDNKSKGRKNFTLMHEGTATLFFCVDRVVLVKKEKLVQKFLNKWTIFLFCSILFSSNQKEH